MPDSDDRDADPGATVVDTLVACPHCGGSGRGPDADPIVKNGSCWCCKGSGRVAPATAAAYAESEEPLSAAKGRPHG